MPVPMRGGKEYATVQERLHAAHGETAQPVGVQSVVTDALALTATVVVLRATVTFADGRTFTGISEAQFDATSGADKTNPIEVAETSAVGRALAFAGYYGSADGIAGAEEVRQAQRRQQPPQPAQAAPPKVTREQLWARYRQLADELVALAQSGRMAVPEAVTQECHLPPDVPNADLVAAYKRLRAWRDGINGQGRNQG